ncbi:MAG: hypothetical protein Q4A58_07155 [Fusobacterium sp.]|uniref:hypothetical protein n=1 Tax=Fusobacterium sp. TaxID=68766 RepID=UPI0026DB262B|nr:hypothetical protein [Fusobacterium sp.]MDO4691054.1 hypothetical protein [Fusobacterium sp.]
MLSVLSLVLILIENSLPLDGMILFTSLPFISYTVKRKGSIFFLLLTYILITTQTDRYFYIFLVILFYIILNGIVLSFMDYNKRTAVYILLLQIAFYGLLSFNVFSIKCFIINICGFIFWNYIYTKYIEIKG